MDSLGDSSCKKSLPRGCRSLRTCDRVSLMMGVAWRTCGCDGLVKRACHPYQSLNFPRIGARTLQATMKSKLSGSKPCSSGSLEISRTAYSIAA